MIEFERKEDIIDTLIFVEGISDLAFLSLLLINLKNYRYEKDLLQNSLKNGEKCSQYIKDNNRIIIFSVGGIGKFSNGYNTMLPMIKQESTKRVIFIADNDFGDETKTIDKINIDIVNKPNTWYEATIKDDYGDNKNIEVFVKIVPKDEIGSLESLLINAVEEQEPEIVNSSIHYIDNLDEKESKYIKKERMKRKAKTGVIFTLLSPDKTFDELQKKFELINLDCETIKNNYDFLIEKL